MHPFAHCVREGRVGACRKNKKIAVCGELSCFEAQFGVDYFARTRGVSTLSSPAVIVKLLSEMRQLRKELRAIKPVV